MFLRLNDVVLVVSQDMKKLQSKIDEVCTFQDKKRQLHHQNYKRQQENKEQQNQQHQMIHNSTVNIFSSPTHMDFYNYSSRPSKPSSTSPHPVELSAFGHFCTDHSADGGRTHEHLPVEDDNDTAIVTAVVLTTSSGECKQYSTPLSPYSSYLQSSSSGPPPDS